MEFMLASGHSRTWMIANTIVTITTSGTYIAMDGVCDNCLALRRTTDIAYKGKAKAEANVKQKSAALDGSTEDSASQTSSDQASGAVQSGVTASQAPVGAQLKSGSEESAKPDSAKTEETRSSTVSDRRQSEPFVPVNPMNCQCVCQGWAEIFIRRPSGNISWIMRIQNRAMSSCLDSDVSTAVVDDPQIGDCKFGYFLLQLDYHLETLNIYMGNDFLWPSSRVSSNDLVYSFKNASDVTKFV